MEKRFGVRSNNANGRVGGVMSSFSALAEANQLKEFPWIY